MKFLHTADWQLGKPFARVEDPDKAAKVRAARIDAIVRVGELVSEHGLDLVLVAGDLFDSVTPEKSVVSAACGAIGRIDAPVIVIPGNHDHGGPGSLWEQPFFLQERESLAPNCRVLLEPSPLELDDAVIFPCPLLRRHETGDPTAWIRDFDFSTLSDPDAPRIVLAHGSVHGFDGEAGDEEEDSGASNLLSLDRLPRAEIDYVALGDWHGTRQVDAAAWYSGTPEIDRFPRGESNDPGHVLIVEAARGRPPEVETIATGALQWHRVGFDFTRDEDLERFDEVIADRIENRAGSDLLHLTLGGALGIDASSRLEERLATLESRLLRLKLRNRVRIAPTSEEVASLADRPGDPVISRVASGLLVEAEGDGDEAAIARLALRELHAACAEE